jgi:hypothetical protein
MQSRR